VTATIRAKDGEAAQWWKVLAFSETVQSEQMRLTDGDALSVQGALKAETYEKDGATRLSLSVVADQVLAHALAELARHGNVVVLGSEQAIAEANARREDVLQVTKLI
jgi:single-stranded DNA-binding protein